MNPESIQFFTEDLSYRIREKRKLRGDLEKVITGENFKQGPLNIILCSDRYLREYNQRYLKHDYFTDVIAFDLSTEQNKVSGDIYISLDRIRENAKQYNVSIKEELLRVMIHGILHLMGMVDQREEEKHAMREKENSYLANIMK